MFKDRTDYIRHTFAAEDDTLRAIRATLTDPNDGIAVTPEDGRLLQMLARLVRAEKIVEIGTLGGYSSGWMAQALPDHGKIYTLERDARRAALARANIGHDTRIHIVTGDATETLASLVPHGPFDMVFIDADKNNYGAYLDWAETHVRTGGLIVADNTLLFDAVWTEGPVARVRDTTRQTMRDFNARLADTAKYTSIMLPTAAGMTIAMKNG